MQRDTNAPQPAFSADEQEYILKCAGSMTPAQICAQNGYKRSLVIEFLRISGITPLTAREVENARIKAAIESDRRSREAILAQVTQTGIPQKIRSPDPAEKPKRESTKEWKRRKTANEAEIAKDLKADYPSHYGKVGDRILGSKYFRDYCYYCLDPIRVANPGAVNVCDGCVGDSMQTEKRKVASDRALVSRG